MTTVLHVGIWQDHEFGGDKVFGRGLAANGCRSEPFDYRTQAARYGTDRMNQELRERAAGKDLVFIGKGELVARRTLAEVRRKGSLTVLWYGDLRPQPEPWLIDLLPEVDVFFMSSAGTELRSHFELGRPGRAAFYLNPGDRFLASRYRDAEGPSCSVVMTATPHVYRGSDRARVVRYLWRRGDVQFYGGCETQRFDGLPRLLRRLMLRRATPTPLVRGDAYAAAIRSARIGVGVSYRQDVPRYTSDRLSHYLTLGTLYLPMYFADVEVLFTHGRELLWYDDIPSLDRLLRRLLADEAERHALAAVAQRKMVEDYGTENMVGMMLDIIRTGRSDRFPWVEVHG